MAYRRYILTKRSARLTHSLRNGTVLIGSDAHYWPGKPSTAHRAFVLFAGKRSPTHAPDLVIMNGDVIDAATISRHPPIGWEKSPSIERELDTAADRLSEIEKASPAARHIWTLGNHDARFETRIASLIPELKGVKGVSLKDHFPAWEPAWSVELPGVIVKHRFKGGAHAAYNNAVSSGRSIVTGHLHAANVTAYTDYNGTRWGVDGGTMADPTGPQFTGYTEDNPLNWREGFVVLTFKNGKLLWPELVTVVKPGVVNWRGELINV